MGTKTLVGAAALSVGFFALGFVARPLIAPLDEPAAPNAAAPLSAKGAPALAGRAEEERAARAEPTATRAPPAKKKDDWDRSDPKQWLARVNVHEVTQYAVPYFKMLAKMPPEEARPLLAWIFPRMNHEEKRVECVRVFGRRPRDELMMFVLDLALEDPTARVRKDAIHWAEAVGLRPFAEDVDALEAWVQKSQDKPIADIITESSHALARDLKTLSGVELERRLDGLNLRDLLDARPRRVDVRSLLKADGLLDHLVQSLPDGDTDEARDVRGEIMNWVAGLQPTPAFVEKHFFDVLRNPATYPKSLPQHVYALVGSVGTPAAIDALIAAYETAVSKMNWWGISMALVQAKATRAIPTMIAMIESDNAYNSIYGIGYFGLHKFTGVKYDESHDGRWWREWWERNSHRFAKEVPDPEIPRLSPRGRGDPK